MVRSTVTRSGAAARAIAVAVALGALAACDAPGDTTGRLLELAPSDAEVVIAIDPARVVGTWAEATLAAIAEGHVPACVVDAARASASVVVAWSPGTGAMIAIAGRRADASCPELVRRGADRVWSDGLEPANDRGTGPAKGGDRFFATRERRQRWARLPDAPVQAIADIAVSVGIPVHARGTADPRDGLRARMWFRTDDRATLLSLREGYLRWRSSLDRERLGAAWPAFAAMTTAEDRSDPERRSDVLEIRLPGPDGGEAASLALLALAQGLGGSAPHLPCPASLGDFTGRAACRDGELTLTDELWDELADDPTALLDGVRVVPTWTSGALAGFRVEALSASDALTWLGLENGDVIDAIDGVKIGTPDDVLAAVVRARAARHVELGIQRGSRHGTLAYVAR